jgi:hypothetical protein
MNHNIKIRAGAVVAIFALVFLVIVGGTFAGDVLSGGSLKAMMAGKTVEGKMNDGSAYSEFYQADGMIKGKDYVGKWTIDGNAMCFVNPTSPSGNGCYQIGKNATGIDWMQNGKVLGTGTVSEGNIRNY